MAEDFALNALLTRNSPSDEDDVFNVKTLLNRVGYYDEPAYGITPYPDGRLFQSIARFQKDHDLTVDGWMKPGGETERAMRLVAGRGRPGLIDEDFKFPSAEDFWLSGEIGKGHASHEDDVLMAKRAMGALGYYPKRLLLDPIPIVDRELHNGLTQFQSDNTLYTDGWMGPEGETANALRNALAAREAVNGNGGRGGDETLIGGSGDDVLMGDSGDDRLTTESKEAPDADPEVDMRGYIISAGTDGSEEQNKRPKEEQGSERPQPGDILRPTQEPVDIQQMYRKLEFDPQGKGQYDETFRDPIRAAKASALETEATELTKKEIYAGRFPPGNPQNNEADAFRHAYWSYRVTQELGADAAKRFGDGHEITSFSGKHGARLMDLFNNKVGRELALDPANKGRPAAEVVHEALASGQLQVAPFRMLQREMESERPSRY